MSDLKDSRVIFHDDKEKDIMNTLIEIHFESVYKKNIEPKMIEVIKESIRDSINDNRQIMNYHYIWLTGLTAAVLSIVVFSLF
jgi:hypothetical protein